MEDLISSRRAAERAEEYACQFSGSYNFFYFHDGNKNVSDLVSYQTARGVPAHYEYAPFGAVTAATTNTAFTAFNVVEVNPFRFSSEYADHALGMVCYNYRHYNLRDGRWVSKDRVMHNLNNYSLICNAVLASQDYLGLVDQTTIDLIIMALETMSGHHVSLSRNILLPTILDLLDDTTLGFVHSAVNWFLFGKDFELSFDSYDPGWGPGEFEPDRYANAIENVCAAGGKFAFKVNRGVDTYKAGLYAISRLGAPGQYTVSLDGEFWRTEENKKCRWHFDGKVTMPNDPFDFNRSGGNRSWLGQLITDIVALMQSISGIGHDFNITFKGSRHVEDEGDCRE